MWRNLFLNFFFFDVCPTDQQAELLQSSKSLRALHSKLNDLTVEIRVSYVSCMLTTVPGTHSVQASADT